MKKINKHAINCQMDNAFIDEFLYYNGCVLLTCQNTLSISLIMVINQDVLSCVETTTTKNGRKFNIFILWMMFVVVLALPMRATTAEYFMVVCGKKETF